MRQSEKEKITVKKPDWLKRRLPSGPVYGQTCALLAEQGLHTVCEAAKCPNQWECFSQQTATFLIMGDRCTRDCRFCAVAHGPRHAPDPDEPARIAETVVSMALDYVVITSVTRDDLADGGAGCFAATISAIRNRRPGVQIEVLIPDFKGDRDALDTLVAACPDVINHNIETVARLYPTVRPGANYRRSLDLIAQVARLSPPIPTKSGMMLGLGEKPLEIRQALNDLLEAGCRILTLGQYLQPSSAHLPVDRYVSPEIFADWRRKALGMGFKAVASGPFVRSSYHAGELYGEVRALEPLP